MGQQNLAECIKSERMKRGWTQSDLAGRVQSDVTSVGRWEQGAESARHKPLSNTCIAIPTTMKPSFGSGLILQGLLIFDNVNDFKVARDFIPTVKHGHVLLTTRAQDTGGMAKSIEIEKMLLETRKILPG